MRAEILGAIICGAVAFIALCISVRSFLEKGFIFHNAYLWASKQERERMDKKPLYRQTAIVFALIAVIFLCIAIEFMINTGWLWIVNLGFVIAAIVYVMISSAKK